ncbi:MAG: NAD-dependent epimerase/dehydratase family protein [Blautia sp.]|nr:NAD-dependent epimerase/dehydratase family protein [Blautia sp.]
MRALLVGGTGQISMAITRKLAADGWELYLLNRGTRAKELPEGVHCISADISNETEVLQKLGDMTFDCVGEFIGFVPEQVERDYRLFKGRTNQYLYISSASAYHKPVESYVITEGTSLANPYWEYSRNKIACEEFLMKKFREEGFPVTIVRPSHTYDERNIPVGLHGHNGSWPVIRRMMEGKLVIIPGDGTSLWTVTFNRDFAEGYVGPMGNHHAIGEAFQITSDETLTWNQIYQTIAEALHVELHPYHVASDFLAEVGSRYDYRGALIGDKSASVVFDNKKLKSLVPGFTTKVPFHQGVRISLANILAHPELQKEEPEFDAWCDKLIGTLEEAKRKLKE